MPPPELLRFDGAAFRRYAEWEAALAEWRAARRKWAAAHGVNESNMPCDVGAAPFDFEEMVGGVNLATHEVVRWNSDGTPCYIRRK